ncbi:hypothetical protein D3C86_1463340 [compost metagenome]
MAILEAVPLTVDVAHLAGDSTVTNTTSHLSDSAVAREDLVDFDDVLLEGTELLLQIVHGSSRLTRLTQPVPELGNRIDHVGQYIAQRVHYRLVGGLNEALSGYFVVGAARLLSEAVDRVVVDQLAKHWVSTSQRFDVLHVASANVFTLDDCFVRFEDQHHVVEFFRMDGVRRLIDDRNRGSFVVLNLGGFNREVG